MKEVKKSELPFELGDLKENFSKLKVLIYGQSGLGKTVLSGSITEVDTMNPVLAGDIEGGTTSLASFPYGDKVQITKIKSFSQGDGNYMKVHNFLVENPDVYGTFLIDSITELQAMIVEELCAKANKSEPDLKVWGSTASEMRSVIRKIRDLDMHVIATCLEKEDTDQLTGEKTYGPLLSGKMGLELPGFFDIVGRLTMEKNKDGEDVRVLHFKNNKGIVAKDRSDSLGSHMVNPTMKKIYDKIRTKHQIN